jgi:hypothetical protein
MVPESTASCDILTLPSRPDALIIAKAKAV